LNKRPAAKKPDERGGDKGIFGGRFLAPPDAGLRTVIRLKKRRAAGLLDALCFLVH